MTPGASYNNVHETLLTLIFLRGIDKILTDLIINKKFAENSSEIILGTSYFITEDTPTENMLAVSKE